MQVVCSLLFYLLSGWPHTVSLRHGHVVLTLKKQQLSICQPNLDSEPNLVPKLSSKSISVLISDKNSSFTDQILSFVF